MWLYLLDDAKKPFFICIHSCCLAIIYLFIWGWGAHAMACLSCLCLWQRTTCRVAFFLPPCGSLNWSQSQAKSQTECLRLLNWLTGKFWFVALLRQDLTVEHRLVLTRLVSSFQWCSWLCGEFWDHRFGPPWLVLRYIFLFEIEYFVALTGLQTCWSCTPYFPASASQFPITDMCLHSRLYILKNTALYIWKILLVIYLSSISLSFYHPSSIHPPLI